MTPLTGDESCTLVIFGASGDLARRKLIPALWSMFQSRVLPEPFTTEDAPVFAALERDDAGRVLEDAVGPGAAGVLDAARLAVALRRARVVHLNTVRDAVDLPLLYLPYLFVRDHGLRVTRMVADALGAELGL